MNNSDIIMPDLSQLTEDERKIIENVMQRQKEEEDVEQATIRFSSVAYFSVCFLPDCRCNRLPVRFYR